MSTLSLSLSLSLKSEKAERDLNPILQGMMADLNSHFHFHSIFFFLYNIPMADLNSLACMWVSHDVNLLDHKDR